MTSSPFGRLKKADSLENFDLINSLPPEIVLRVPVINPLKLIVSQNKALKVGKK